MKMGVQKADLPQIRKIVFVVDSDDQFSPVFTIDDFVRQFGSEPDPPRYRTFELEVLACAHDGEPVLVSECGSCPKFIRRMGDRILCRAASYRD